MLHCIHVPTVKEVDVIAKRPDLGNIVRPWYYSNQHRCARLPVVDWLYEKALIAVIFLRNIVDTNEEEVICFVEKALRIREVL